MSKHAQRSLRRLGGKPDRSQKASERTHTLNPGAPGLPSIARGMPHTQSSDWEDNRNPPDNGDFQTMKSTHCQASIARQKNVYFEAFGDHDGVVNLILIF